MRFPRLRVWSFIRVIVAGAKVGIAGGGGAKVRIAKLQNKLSFYISVSCNICFFIVFSVKMLNLKKLQKSIN